MPTTRSASRPRSAASSLWSDAGPQPSPRPEVTEYWSALEERRALLKDKLGNDEGALFEIASRYDLRHRKAKHGGRAARRAHPHPRLLGCVQCPFSRQHQRLCTGPRPSARPGQVLVGRTQGLCLCLMWRMGGRVFADRTGQKQFGICLSGVDVQQ
ncbi:hypothetical protein GCM10010277_88140 [Streptomyces longisporoflavus]|nr:hypothetical protein GCM10010277_88140 [Streptomyces longisporoflavus]